VLAGLAAAEHHLHRVTVDTVVMGGAGQPLDVAVMRRTIPDRMRRAVAARDRGCAHPGCDRTPSWCQVHHVIPWEQGGQTRLSNLVMLCKTHHREIHTSEWAVRVAADGIPDFTPPTWIDPLQGIRRRPPPPNLPPRPPGPIATTGPATT
jgi:HNH endonuclease